MDPPDTITVEVAYAFPDRQELLTLRVPADTTLLEALRLSRIQARYPALDLLQISVGIFGRISDLRSSLRNGDRIEIYRPLIAEPKQIRRRRASAAKQSAAAEKISAADRERKGR
jgi:putative ubiquitin-RnfH superfamily antitoxin RatB of RatAB toxin-antitoxin module